MTLEELTEKREELLKALGVARVDYGDRSVQFSDIAKALSIIDNEIETLQPSSSGSGTHYASFSKGMKTGDL